MVSRSRRRSLSCPATMSSAPGNRHRWSRSVLSSAGALVSCQWSRVCIQRWHIRGIVASPYRSIASIQAGPVTCVQGAQAQRNSGSAASLRSRLAGGHCLGWTRWRLSSCCNCLTRTAWSACHETVCQSQRAGGQHVGNTLQTFSQHAASSMAHMADTGQRVSSGVADNSGVPVQDARGGGRLLHWGRRCAACPASDGPAQQLRACSVRRYTGRCSALVSAQASCVPHVLINRPCAAQAAAQSMLQILDISTAQPACITVFVAPLAQQSAMFQIIRCSLLPPAGSAYKAGCGWSAWQLGHSARSRAAG